MIPNKRKSSTVHTCSRTKPILCGISLPATLNKLNNEGAWYGNVYFSVSLTMCNGNSPRSNMVGSCSRTVSIAVWTLVRLRAVFCSTTELRGPECWSSYRLSRWFKKSLPLYRQNGFVNILKGGIMHGSCSNTVCIAV